MAWQLTSLGFNVIPCLFCYISNNSKVWWCHGFWWHCPYGCPKHVGFDGGRETTPTWYLLTDFFIPIKVCNF